jgi:hypothetical protein
MIREIEIEQRPIMDPKILGADPADGLDCVGISSFGGGGTQSLVDAPGPVAAYRAAMVRTASSTT